MRSARTCLAGAACLATVAVRAWAAEPPAGPPEGPPRPAPPRFGLPTADPAILDGPPAAFLEVSARHRGALAAPGAIGAACAGLLADYRRLLEDDPALLPALYNAAVLLDECGRPAESERALRELAKRHPDYGRAWCALGALAHRRGEVAEATRLYRHCLERDPTVVEGNVNVAAMEVAEYERTRDPDTMKSAVKHIRTALAVDGSNAPARILFIYLYYVLWPTVGDPDPAPMALHGPAAAKAMLEKVLKDSPDYAPAWNLLGLFELKAGEIHAAIRAFDTATASSPTYVPALVNRALTAVGYRDFVKAIDRLEAAARVAPGDPEVLRLLAAAYRFRAAELADPPARAALLGRAAEVEARAGTLR